MRIPNRRNHVTEARFRTGAERIVGAGNEINAGSRKELLERLVELASMVSSGELAPLTDTEVASVSERRAEFTAAFNDRTSSAWAELGAAISAEIVTRVEREGFMRSLLDRANLEQGSIPRIRVREPNVRAVLARGVAQTFAQYVRDKYITTDEFHISANPHVDLIELQQGSADILEDKYFEGLESILTQEDRTVKRLLDTTIGLYNDVTYFANGLTPQVLGAAKIALEEWRLPAANMLFSIDLLNDICFGTSFSTYFDPISKYEIVMSGRLGNLFGMTLITDGYREPSLQVLGVREFYITTQANLLGAYTDRGPVNSAPSDQTTQGIQSRGWFMNETISAVVANAKGVVKGKAL